MLVLFDIDGTLLKSNRAGLRAMATALKDLHGVQDVDFAEIQTAGRLDPLIWRDLYQHFGISTDAGGHDAFRAAYGSELARLIELESPVFALPGVHDAVGHVRDHDHATCALLTGNYMETGWMKVHAAGFADEDFAFGVWGNEAETRRGLPEIAINRHLELHNVAADPSRVLVIGDTPADIDCAKANGCRSLAVASGGFGLDELSEHEPDELMQDLSDLDQFRRVIDSLSA